jgi:hypothetical protein
VKQRVNHVPTEPIRKLVENYLKDMNGDGEYKTDGRDPSQMEALAKRAGVSYDDLRRLVGKLESPGNPRRQQMFFDTADKLVCAMNMVDVWWGDLKDIYYGVELRDRPSVTLDGLSETCRHGHTRTVETTGMSWSPKSNKWIRFCRTCDNKSSRAVKRRKKEDRASG